MKKLTCHCGAVEAEVNVPDKFEKVLRCNCSVCKRKGYVMSPIGENDMKITKGEDKLTLYQFYTNTAKHYFCSICGIFTHTRPRSNPKLHMINIAIFIICNFGLLLGLVCVKIPQIEQK